ncbi:MAG: IS200/IS605 family transposase [Bacteroidota bacterium]|nr:IS200/IS605 family transposase [Bacteroidota bacterium]
MANTYTQLNVQTVFAVKGRNNILASNFRTQLFEYIAGILRNSKQYPLAINGFKDHVHIFFELNPDTSLSDVLEKVKSNSSKWINTNRFVMGRFEWQRGFSGFTYSKSQRKNVIQYIMNQENHHQVQTFKEEYLRMLRKFEMEFDERYIFEFYD